MVTSANKYCAELKPSDNKAAINQPELDEQRRHEAIADEWDGVVQQVQNPAAALLLWDNFLLAEERKHLGGNLSAAYEKFGTAGMWIELHGGSRRDAILAVAREIGVLSEVRHRSLLLQLGQPVSRPWMEVKPSWDKKERTLWLGEEIIRTIHNSKAAKNISLILDSFEELKWPQRIDDPLSGGPNRQRLHAAVKSLNQDLSAIKFGADGTGKGIVWRRL